MGEGGLCSELRTWLSVNLLLHVGAYPMQRTTCVLYAGVLYAGVLYAGVLYAGVRTDEECPST